MRCVVLSKESEAILTILKKEYEKETGNKATITDMMEAAIALTLEGVFGSEK